MPVRRVVVRGVAAALLTLTACTHPTAAPTAAPVAPTSTTVATPSGSPTSQSSQDPARFAPIVLARAQQAGVNPQLLMAILYNESYKPHDPALERAWQRMHPDAAFGVANMHQAAFEDTRRGRDFATRSWQDLPDDPDLAIEAAAWYLHDLAAALPADHVRDYTDDELLALGYDAGPGNMAAYARGTPPAADARSYLDRLRQNWTTAGSALHR